MRDSQVEQSKQFASVTFGNFSYISSLNSLDGDRHHVKFDLGKV